MQHCHRILVHVRHQNSLTQQRLVVLELKLSQISFLEQAFGEQPLLLLDDIFSELDSGHIHKVLERTNACQTIITTTHKEFVEKELATTATIITLG